MSELKPCPFCGGEAETLTVESMYGGYLFGIMCNDCLSRGDVYDTEAEAIAAWNTRVERTTTRNGKYRTRYGRRVPLCECCGYAIGDDRYNYCPNCGARVVE